MKIPKEIKVTPKTDYGKKRFYPACEGADLWLSLMRREKSFTEKDLNKLRNLEVEVTYGFRN